MKIKRLIYVLLAVISCNVCLAEDIDIVEKYQNIITGIDDFAKYKNYISKDCTVKFNDLSHVAKAAYVLKHIEKVQDDLYKDYYVYFKYSVSKLEKDKYLPDVNSFIISSKLLFLSKQLAVIHVSAVDKFSYGLTEQQKRQFSVYKAKIIKIYQKKGLLPNDLPS